MPGPNECFTFFARRYAEQSATGSASLDALKTARSVMLSLYEFVGAEPPSHFPDIPVEMKFDLGRERWLEAIRHGKITMDISGNPCSADLSPEMQKQVNEYRGFLRDVKHRQIGLRIVLEVTDVFFTWIGRESLEDAMRIATRLQRGGTKRGGLGFFSRRFRRGKEA